MSNITTNTYLGYIEGYYGNLLNWRDRFRLIKALRKNKMNSYFYAPKDDPKHRYNWRKKYSKNWLQKFKNFCSHATENEIEIIIGVSPGADFNFDEIYNKNIFSNDLNILLDKCDTLIKCGASKIAILFDDIPNIFTSFFKKYNEGKSHGKLVKILSEKLNKEVFIVPRIYSDELFFDNPSYICDLISELKHISKLFYCGKYIVNDKFETDEKNIKLLYKKNKVIFWNNFYANDYCPNKLFIGPYYYDPPNKNLMFNLTGYINTDLLIISIINSCLNKKNKIYNWKKIILKNKVPQNFFELIQFFDRPTYSYEEEIRNIKIPENIISNLDFLLWNWKSPLSLEWYKYLFKLKHDLEIFNNRINYNRILKTQTYPMQKILYNRRKK